MKVICFGDSNTYGYDPRSYFGGRYDADIRWVDILTSGHPGYGDRMDNLQHGTEWSGDSLLCPFLPC